MLDVKNIVTLVKKELKTFFDTPTAYIVLIVFLLLWQFLFFRNALLAQEASLRGLFDLLPWLLLFLIPAITMTSISGEKSEGTLELLLTHPVKAIEIILGKFLSYLIFVGITLVFVLPIAFTFAAFGPLDWGIVTGQLLGAILASVMLISLGMFVSSIANNTISSLLISAVATFVLIVIGTDFFTSNVPLALAPLLEQLSVVSHYNSMIRGVIDTRDIWYFLSGTVIFLSLTYWKLIKSKFGNRKNVYQGFQVGITLLIAIALLTNIAGYWIPGRLDLTQGQLYSLSDGTKKTLQELKDVVNITLFASTELPTGFQPILRDTKDILRDYQTYGNNNIIVTQKDPANPDVVKQAQEVGVREVQFNVVGQGELQVKKGYLGLGLSYGTAHEAIPFIKDTSDLEYQLTSFIKEITTPEKKKVLFLGGQGEKSINQDYRVLDQELSKQFNASEITIDDKQKTLPTDMSVLVIAGPTQALDDNLKQQIKTFINNGGSVLFLIDTLSLSLQTLGTTPNPNSGADLLKEYGVDVQSDMVYDVKSNQVITFNTGDNYVMSAYPFWPRVLPADQSSVITNNIQSMVLPWSSSIVLNDATIKQQGFAAGKLFVTSKFAGTQTQSINLRPDQTFNQDKLAESTMAVQLTGQDGKKGRLIVVGDSDFLTDQVLQQTPENLAFALSSISWLAQEDSLASIQLKQNAARKLTFENDGQKTAVQYGNMLAVILVPLLIAAWRFTRRKNLRKKVYEI